MLRFGIQILLLTLAIAASAERDPHEFSFERLNRRNMLTNGMATDNSAVPTEELDPYYWRKMASVEIQKRLVEQPNTNKAKNVIFFLGDGMSLTTITAARILKGQRDGKPGEESQLAFEKFPYTALSRTYCTNAQVADSACTSTAYLTGVKTNILSLGVGPKVNYNDCEASMDP
ncbi:alkaline phosphatase, tissue-nonspecific isozyme-like, partial [Rhagoletis pomonella]|uniref:alkaline phosphatase, tissue-nonspecific isozyme-like n=1 Tax=Rhagoletis pomonella TaxID=28610 RepID=UPI00177CDE5C